MVNRPELTRRPRRKRPETLPDNGSIQLEITDYICDEEEEQQLKNILLDVDFWLDMLEEVESDRSQ